MCVKTEMFRGASEHPKVKHGHLCVKCKICLCDFIMLHASTYTLRIARDTVFRLVNTAGHMTILVLTKV